MSAYKEGAAEKLRQAAQLISEAMTWRDAQQGSDYWGKVHGYLLENATAAERSTSCKEGIADLKKRLAELEARCT